ncbi:MAG: hypothetical protein V1755_05200 [Chloroflexota bacterium]
MASTDSGVPKKLDAMPLEQVVGMARNRWSASIGIAGRHGPDYALYWEGSAKAYILRVVNRLKAAGSNEIQERDAQVRQSAEKVEVDPSDVGKHLIQLANTAFSTGSQEAIDLLVEWVSSPPRPQDRGRLYQAWALWLLGKTGFFVTFEKVLLRLCESQQGRDVINVVLDGRQFGPDLPTLQTISLNLSPEALEKWNAFYDRQKPWVNEAEQAAIAKSIFSEYLERIRQTEKCGWESRDTPAKEKATMLDPTTVPILLKTLDFLFGEGSKILQERRERRKASQEGSKLKTTDTVATGKLDLAEAIQSKEAALSQRVTPTAWATSEAKAKHLLNLLDTHTRNYYLAKEQYAKYGSALVLQPELR